MTAMGQHPDCLQFCKGMLAALLMCCLAAAAADVSHLVARDDATESPPPRPYAFSYTAGRFPGHADRQHTEVSDGSGVVRGTFSYVDPRHQVRTVDYVADREGFHPVLSHAPPAHPRDSAAVALEKERHFRLYSQIADQHASEPHPGAASPLQTAAVRDASERHAELFRRIAEQHARIAAERELLQRDAELDAPPQDVEH